MKKIMYFACLGFLLSGVATAADEINVYGKIGVDVHSKFSNTSDIGEDGIESSLGFPRKGSTNLGLFLEVTKNITSNIELGAGLGYVHRKGKDTTIVSGVGTAYGKPSKSYDKFKAPRYSSVPLYAIIKYNFDTNSNFKPYIKADLGYSFNKIKSSLDVHEVSDNKSAVGNENDYKVGLKVKNGLYAGVGVGVEYNHFLAEIAYIHTSAKVISTWTGEDFEDGSETQTDKYNEKAVRLLVGYKFSY